MKELVIVPQSFIGEAFQSFKRYIEKDLFSECFDDECRFVIFDGVKEGFELLKDDDPLLLKNYNTIMELLADKGKTPQVLKDVYSIDEYFYDNIDKNEVYVTFTDVRVNVVASAALLGYKNLLFVFVPRKGMPENCQRDVVNFNVIDKRIRRTMDSENIPIEDFRGKSCWYEIGGKEYKHTIEPEFDSGFEGYVMRCADTNYCLKIFKNENEPDREAFVFEKIQKMIDFYKYYMNKGISFPGFVSCPVAWVYDETKQKKIGYVMHWFDGVEYAPKELSLHSQTKDIVSRLFFSFGVIKAYYWLELHGWLHRDALIHNIMYNENFTKVTLIDVASAQYRSYPANAIGNSDGMDCALLPSKYKNNSKIYSTVEFSYVCLNYLVNFIIRPQRLFRCYNDDGSYMFFEESRDKLEAKYPEIYGVLDMALNRARPAAIARQMLLLGDYVAGVGGVPAPAPTPTPTPTPIPAPNPTPSPRPKIDAKTLNWLQLLLLSWFDTGTRSVKQTDYDRWVQLYNSEKFKKKMFAMGTVAVALIIGIIALLLFY